MSDLCPACGGNVVRLCSVCHRPQSQCGHTANYELVAIHEPVNIAAEQGSPEARANNADYARMVAERDRDELRAALAAAAEREKGLRKALQNVSVHSAHLLASEPQLLSDLLTRCGEIARGALSPTPTEPPK